MTITYLPEILPMSEPDDDAAVVIRHGWREWPYDIAELRMIDGALWGRLVERDDV